MALCDTQSIEAKRHLHPNRQEKDRVETTSLPAPSSSYTRYERMFGPKKQATYPRKHFLEHEFRRVRLGGRLGIAARWRLHVDQIDARKATCAGTGRGVPAASSPGCRVRSIARLFLAEARPDSMLPMTNLGE